MPGCGAHRIDWVRRGARPVRWRTPVAGSVGRPGPAGHRGGGDPAAHKQPGGPLGRAEAEPSGAGQQRPAAVGADQPVIAQLLDDRLGAVAPRRAAAATSASASGAVSAAAAVPRDADLAHDIGQAR